MVAAGLLGKERGRARAAQPSRGSRRPSPPARGSSWTTWATPDWWTRSSHSGSTSSGYGCTTCIGNSGPLLDGVSDAVRESDLAVCAVLSGNRNFEGRIHPDVRMNYLASPPLVVAYALAGSLDVDLLASRSASTPMANRCTCVTSGPPRRRSPTPSEAPSTPRCSARATTTPSPATSAGAASTSRRERPSTGGPHRATSADRRSSRHLGLQPRARPGHRRRSRPRRARRQHHHRPHLPGRIDQGRQPRGRLPARPAPRAPRTSTPTGPGAATTK